ncbi:tetratricopeptide repeat protein [Nannocystaceae bacterium ST9]
MRRPLPLVILLLLCACDRASSSEQSAAKTGEGAAKAEPAKDAKAGETKAGETKPGETKPGDAKAEKPKPAKPADLSAKQAGELRKQFRSKLDEGRKLTKEGKHEAGIKLYHEALAIEPSNPAALAELGWAALQANQLDLAQGATSQALIFSRKADQQGMILYNLGRVAEARSQTDDAIAHYRESLARRPNATVQKRLDDLLAGAVGVAPPSEGLARLGEGVAGLDAACKLLIEQECANIYTVEDNGCVCETELGDEASGWALLELGEGDIGENVLWFPAVKTSSGWTVFASIAWIYNPGMFGIFEEATWALPESKDLLPGGESEWVLNFSKDRSDSDMGINEFESESYAMSVVCAREGAQAWCTEPLLREYDYSRDVQFAEDEYEGADEIEHEGLPIESKSSCKLELGAQVIVSEVTTTGQNVDGYAGDVSMLAAGEYDLAFLLGKTPVAAPAGK